MNIVFRADANRNIGMGHVMRCLSIADEFEKLGNHVVFVLADEGIENLVIERGHNAIVLHSDYKKMEEELSLWPTEMEPDLIIVDSYYVTNDYLKALHDKARSNDGLLIYIDDVYKFPYSVDILVNYNAYAAEKIYDTLYAKSNEKPCFILGPTYAPLRSMFRGVTAKEQTEHIRNILISTGGSDELHLALALVKHIGKNPGNEVNYHILLGNMNMDKEEIKDCCKKNIILHENVVDMKSLIRSCDIVVSAAGSTLYEICACGVPLITYSLADNQILGAEAFDRLKLGVNVGELRDPDTIDSSAIVSGRLKRDAALRILSAIEELAEDFKKRKQMAKRMQRIIDGLGSKRLVEKMLAISLRNRDTYH